MLRLTRALGGIGLRQPTRLGQTWARPMLQLKNYSSNKNAPLQNRRPRKDEAPRVRYLLYVFLFSTGLLVLATRLVDKKKAPQTTFTEREYQEYERESGIKRRSKLISGLNTDKYHFYAVPYVDSDATLDKIASKLPKDKEVKIIDPALLVKQETKDPDRKYSILLNDLKYSGKPIPRGLITALIKQEVEFFLNTSKGTHDTNILLKNYPQSTYEATKFENDISDLTSVIVLKDDIEKELPAKKLSEDIRLINNVVGYYDTVGRNYELAGKSSEWDDKAIKVDAW